jgi:nitrogenase-stabilizing/protective protein
MNSLPERLKTLSSAEDFFTFFGVPFEVPVMQVNRLHILKRFYQYLNKAEGLAGLDDVEMLRRYRVLLGQAYQDFVKSTPAQEKVFKVFQDTNGTQHVQLSSLRASLPHPREPQAQRDAARAA